MIEKCIHHDGTSIILRCLTCRPDESNIKCPQYKPEMKLRRTGMVRFQARYGVMSYAEFLARQSAGLQEMHPEINYFDENGVSPELRGVMGL